MSMNKRRLRGIAALFVALTLSNGHIIALPDFMAGFLVGAAIVFMMLSMLPDKTLEKLKRWKHHG